MNDEFGPEADKRDMISLGGTENAPFEDQEQTSEAKSGTRIADESPARGTSVGLLVTGLIGSVISILLFALLYWGLSHDSYLYLFFWRSPSIPFATSLLFFWGLSILVLKLGHLRREYLAFTLDLLPSGQYQLITKHDVHEILREINKMPAERQNLLLVTRVWRALKRVRATGSTGEVDDLLEYQANIDASTVESTYAAVKVFIWAIPVVGFIGTVMGISISIGNFGELVQNVSDLAEIKAGLGTVTDGLAVAFETTLLALILSIVIMFFSTYVRKKEDDLLTRVEDYCVEHLVNKLSVGDDKLVSDLNEAFSEAQEDALRRQADVVEGALVELHERQERVLKEFNELLDQKHVDSLERLTQSLRELFSETGSQQASRFSEMSQRLERGLRSLGESLQPDDEHRTTAQLAPQSPTMVKGGEADAIVDAISQQTTELREFRDAMQALTRSFEHLATLQPFEEVMANIQKALDALIPAIDELKKPRELRIIDAPPVDDAPAP